MTKSEKMFYIVMIVIAILILGVQIGIFQGKKLQVENMEFNNGYLCAN